MQWSIHRHARRHSALCGLLIAAPLTLAQARPVTVLHAFTGGADGAYPATNVVVDAAGNLYGEAELGGIVCQPQAPGGCGTVFKLAPTGAVTALVTFRGSFNGVFGDGDMTLAGHRLFGSAFQGGGQGFGLLFALNTDGANFTVLHRFTGLDGANPVDRPVITAGGVLFDTTPVGGPPCPSGFPNCGVLFQLNPDGSYIALHHFTGGVDGVTPGRIVIDAHGTIYGATQGGGASFDGVLYSYRPATGVFTVLHDFTYAADGASPAIGGIAPDGTVYGATYSGGTHGKGTLFALSTAPVMPVFQTLWMFTGGQDGAYPAAGPAVDPTGALTGTTSAGPGKNSAGTLYRYAQGSLTTLHEFTMTTAAAPGQPTGTPALTPTGTIYATTLVGGIANCMLPNGPSPLGCGTVFSQAPAALLPLP